jgi:hypothetical protein
VCRGGFEDLTPGEIRLICFENFDYMIPCFDEDAYIQVVGVGKLRYDDPTPPDEPPWEDPIISSFSARVIMMQVVPRGPLP